jgi:hypothetical protein
MSRGTHPALLLAAGLLGGTLLGGAAAPPADCGQPMQPTRTYPMPTDLSGHPQTGAGLAGQTFATLPSPDSSGCHSAFPASADNALRSENADVVHGLPMPDILRPITDPQPKPEFR